MEFIKRHISTIVLITIAASWVGVSLGTKDCPSCVVADIAKHAMTVGSQEVAAAQAENEKPKPKWSVVDTEGKLITNDDLQGKVSVLVYWATWCGGCKKEIPDLVALREEFSEDQVFIVGLSVDKPYKDLQAYKEAVGINYQVARVNGSIEEAFGVPESIPALIVMDQEGRIHFRHTGIVTKDTLSEWVRTLLATSGMERKFGS